jgi:hypothetical protein
VTRLDIPDGHVGEYQDDVARVIRTRFDLGDPWIAPWAHVGHPDHDAVGRASDAGSAEAGATLFGYLVGAWHGADPAGTDGAEPEDAPVLPPNVLWRFSRSYEIYVLRPGGS